MNTKAAEAEAIIRQQLEYCFYEGKESASPTYHWAKEKIIQYAFDRIWPLLESQMNPVWRCPKCNNRAEHCNCERTHLLSNEQIAKVWVETTNVFAIADEEHKAHAEWKTPEEVTTIVNQERSDSRSLQTMIRVQSERETKDLITKLENCLADERRKCSEWLRRKLMTDGEIVRVPGMTDIKVLHPLDMKELLSKLRDGKVPDGWPGEKNTEQASADECQKLLMECGDWIGNSNAFDGWSAKRITEALAALRAGKKPDGWPSNKKPTSSGLEV